MLKITSLALITFMIAPLHAGMTGSDKAADSQKDGIGFDLEVQNRSRGGLGEKGLMQLIPAVGFDLEVQNTKKSTRYKSRKKR